MRANLGKIENQRHQFSATFERYGTKTNWHGYPVKTLLLKEVTNLKTGEIVTDHLWFNNTKGFQALGNLQLGQIVEFDARVKEYRKGYRGYDLERQTENPPGWDWKLSHPTKIKRAAFSLP